MIATDLVFWVDGLEASGGGGLLCARHADTMTVPRGWTLDDRRDPDLRLFRPPSAEPVVAGRPGRPRRPAAERQVVEQLALDAEPDVAIDEGIATVHELPTPAPAAPPAPSSTAPSPAWRPSFDTDDDLDGKLSARSPLLSRAFGGGRRR